eukprot:TRINITY_DN67022_c10_g1_i1.p1 TRINITY_DN67022_c10_g1~~TRINITY_DN67022_c10_g1_i1.p1  ORF type:complete len:329 (+),score=27.65 TRINITY_DN67022_c10_g1_i1:65-1051(+)
MNTTMKSSSMGAGSTMNTMRTSTSMTMGSSMRGKTLERELTAACPEAIVLAHSSLLKIANLTSEEFRCGFKHGKTLWIAVYIIEVVGAFLVVLFGAAKTDWGPTTARRKYIPPRQWIKAAVAAVTTALYCLTVFEQPWICFFANDENYITEKKSFLAVQLFFQVVSFIVLAALRGYVYWVQIPSDDDTDDMPISSALQSPMNTTLTKRHTASKKPMTKMMPVLPGPQLDDDDPTANASMMTTANTVEVASNSTSQPSTPSEATPMHHRTANNRVSFLSSKATVGTMTDTGSSRHILTHDSGTVLKDDVSGGNTPPEPTPIVPYILNSP